MRFWLIYILSAGVLLANSLSSPYLVGSDVHIEYYYAIQAVGGWDWTLPHSYNASLSVIVAPMLARIFECEVITVFRVVYPLFYALLVPILYLAYKKYIGRNGAFVAGLFIIVSPMFAIEMLGIPRQMIAELFLAGIIVVLFNKRISLWILLTLAVFVVFAHYTTLIMAGGILVIFMLFNAVKAYSRRDDKTLISYRIYRWNSIVIAAVLVVVSVTAYFYYSSVADGWVMQHFTNVVRSISGIPVSSEAAGSPLANLSQIVGIEAEVPTNPAVELAVGTDIATVPPVAQVYRIVQYILFAVTLFGAGWLLIKREYNARLKLMVLFAVVFLAFNLFVPGIGNMLNITRAAHYALISVAPAFYIGVKAISINHMRIGYSWAVFVLVVYWVFAGGLAYEYSGDYPTDRITIPPSYAFSNASKDFGGYFTDDDDNVAAWIAGNGITPVYADVTGVLLLQHRQTMWETWPLPYPQKDGTIPWWNDNQYIFLRTWNNTQGTLAYWVGPGLRRYVDNWLNNYEILYQQGNAMVVILK